LNRVDSHSNYGVLAVDSTTTFLIVLVGTGTAAQYSIEVSDLPGYKG
jgi:hypothetical protein